MLNTLQTHTRTHHTGSNHTEHTGSNHTQTHTHNTLDPVLNDPLAEEDLIYKLILVHHILHYISYIKSLFKSLTINMKLCTQLSS